MTYPDYLKTDHWQHLRYAAQRRDEFKCVRCGSGEDLQVHHKLYRKDWFQTMLSDLETLCEVCHSKTHAPIRKKRARKFTIRFAKLNRRELKVIRFGRGWCN